MPEPKKYPDWKSLIAAYKSGELTEPLVVDNDCCHVYTGSEEDCECVFESGGPHEIAGELLSLLGIPSEGA